APAPPAPYPLSLHDALPISGAFDRDAIIETATRRFAHLTTKPDPEREAARPQSGAAGETRKLEQTHLVFSWPAPSAGSEHIYARSEEHTSELQSRENLVCRL